MISTLKCNTESNEVGHALALRQVLAHEAIGVLIGSALSRRSDHRPGRYQFLPDGIDLQVQPLERVGAQQGHIARFRENDQIRRFRPGCAHQRVADIALDATTIGDFERLFPLRTDAQLLERPAWDPRKLASGIDQGLRKCPARAAQLPILDLDRRSKDSHVVHGKSFVLDLDTNLLQGGPFAALRAGSSPQARRTCFCASLTPCLRPRSAPLAPCSSFLRWPRPSVRRSPPRSSNTSQSTRRWWPSRTCASSTARAPRPRKTRR